MLSKKKPVSKVTSDMIPFVGHSRGKYIGKKYLIIPYNRVREGVDYKGIVLRELCGGDGTVLCPHCGTGSKNPWMGTI